MLARWNSTQWRGNGFITAHICRRPHDHPEQRLTPRAALPEAGLAHELANVFFLWQVMVVRYVYVYLL